jgi:hypothetical protein
MFALPAPPQVVLTVGGVVYRLARVLKHDFFAATCLYQAPSPPRDGRLAKIIVKFGRTQDFCGLPVGWVGEFLLAREEGIYRALEGLEGVPRWLGRLDRSVYAIEYIEGQSLDRVAAPPTGFFDALRRLMDAVHARGVGYGDANKRSNILLDRSGRPYLVDFQISLRRRDELPWPISAVLRRAVEYVSAKDLYHLYKHKRRMVPEELTPEEEALSRRRGGLHGVHRYLSKRYRLLRRRFLSRLYTTGRLVSPTEAMEDDMPEDASWKSREQRR